MVCRLGTFCISEGDDKLKLGQLFERLMEHVMDTLSSLSLDLFDKPRMCRECDKEVASILALKKDSDIRVSMAFRLYSFSSFTLVSCFVFFFFLIMLFFIFLS